MTKATMLDHLWFMNIALEEAELAYKASEVPVGAVLVSSSGSILSKQFNLKENHFNPTGHAEILCLTEAGKKFRTGDFPTALFMSLLSLVQCA
jgi:tRNA(Arg) A34 adenosine deaminase TadA